MTPPARVVAGVPAGGQYAPTVHAEPELTLEALADALGAEDLTFDPDDPYGADLLNDVEHARAMLPEPSTAPDVFARATRPRNRGQIHEAIERNQVIIDGAATDRLELSNRGEQAKMAAFDAATRQAEIDLDAAYADLEMLEQAEDDATYDGLMSVDDMTATQRTQVDAMYGHAYDFAHAAIGTAAIDDSDDAEQFAAFVTRALVDNQFEDTGFELTAMLGRFDADRAGRLAAGFCIGPRHTSWVQEMASAGGFNLSVQTPGGRARRDMLQFTGYLTAIGFRIEERSDPGRFGDQILRIVGGRPAPSAVAS